LFTADGKLGDRLTSPKVGVPKLYEVTVAGKPSVAALRKLSAGVLLDGVRTKPANFAIVESIRHRNIGATGSNSIRHRNIGARGSNTCHVGDPKEQQTGAHDHGFDCGWSSRLKVLLREGRHRQVRRMLASIGHKVKRLKRVAIGPVALGELKAGNMEPLTPGEASALRAACQPSSS